MNSGYYSQRSGRGPRADPTIHDLARALTLAVDELQRRDYLQEWYGYTCIDAGDVDGRAAMPLADHIEAETGWRAAWPLPDPLFDELEHVRGSDLARVIRHEEDKLFDLIEFFHRHVSEGVREHEDSNFHSYGNCGWHYGAFDSAPAQELFRKRINATLIGYREGFRLNVAGEIEHTADDGLDQLIDAQLQTRDPDVAKRVAGAIALYRHRGRTGEDMRLAVRDLYDVLEKLRPHVKAEMLRGDEGDLFNIANNFTIRHLNASQKGNYDSVLWQSWMFYVNLATIHLITRTVERASAQQQKKA